MPRQLLKKDGILEKASLLFWDKGYDKTSLKDIAGACGFKAANMYNYFKSKENVLFNVLRNEITAFISAVKHLEKDDTILPNEQLRLFINNHINMGLQKRSGGQLFDMEFKNLSPQHRKSFINLRNQYENILISIIRKGVETKIYRHQLDIKLTAYFIISILARTRIWYSPNGRLSKGQIADRIFDVILYGLISQSQTTPAKLTKRERLMTNYNL